MHSSIFYPTNCKHTKYPIASESQITRRAKAGTELSEVHKSMRYPKPWFRAIERPSTVWEEFSFFSLIFQALFGAYPDVYFSKTNRHHYYDENRGAGGTNHSYTVVRQDPLLTMNPFFEKCLEYNFSVNATAEQMIINVTKVYNMFLRILHTSLKLIVLGFSQSSNCDMHVHR